MRFLFKDSVAEKIFTPRASCRFNEEFATASCMKYGAVLSLIKQKKLKTLESIMRACPTKYKEFASVADVWVLGASGAVEMKEPINTAGLVYL